MGKWTDAPTVDADAKRGAGRCFWYGCEEKGWLANPYMVNQPFPNRPHTDLCTAHRAIADRQVAEDARIVSAWLVSLTESRKWSHPVKPASPASKERRQRLRKVMANVRETEEGPTRDKKRVDMEVLGLL